MPESAEPLKLTGEPPEQEPEKPTRRRGGDEPAGARSARRNAGELKGRLESVFERLAEWLEGRGDAELATVIREDAAAMTGGLVALTKPLAWLRGPLILVLGVVEPALAFGRVLRVLAGRWSERRERKAAEQPPAGEPAAELVQAWSEAELREALTLGDPLGSEWRPYVEAEMSRRGLEP